MMLWNDMEHASQRGEKKRGRALFSRSMKRTHTIFLPQMLEYHSDFLRAAFAGSGYHLEIMRESGNLKELSLRYISSDYCYPTILILGQVLKILQSEEVPLDRIAFLEPQTGGACRAGNIYHAILQTLKRCGQEQIPVISLNFTGDEKHPGFQITPKLLFAAVAAVCYGDLILCLFQQTEPYECHPGETAMVRRQLTEKLSKQLRMHHGILGSRERSRGCRMILDAFCQIPIQSTVKKKVGVTGEIYMKFSSLGNHGLEQFLKQQNCQCFQGGFINYAIYVMDGTRSSYLLQNTDRPVWKPVFDLVLRYLMKVQMQLYREADSYKCFQMDIPYSRLKEKAVGLLGDSCITGDGWLVAAEAVEAIEQGCRHVLILHPFGCLVSHVCERGIIKKLRQRYPGINIQTIEYDYDSSDTLRESRILLGLSESPLSKQEE